MPAGQEFLHFLAEDLRVCSRVKVRLEHSVQCVAMLFEEFWQPLGVNHAQDATPARLIRRAFDGHPPYEPPELVCVREIVEDGP